MIERLRILEDHLVVLVLATVVVGLITPAAGVALRPAVGWLLALLLFTVSLTFDATRLRRALSRRGVLLTSTCLVYLGMGAVGVVIATVVVPDRDLWLGVVLLAFLPTDVSAPLLVWIARGEVALATVLNAVNTALSPVLTPLLFLAVTGVRLETPVLALTAQLLATVVLPTAAGVALRTRWPVRTRAIEPVLSATGALTYLALLLAVVGPNAAWALGNPAGLLRVALAAVLLNAAGFLLAAGTRPWLPSPADRTAMLFTVSKKEFGIAALVVVASGLPSQVAIPAAVYAVVQMVTSPLVARFVASRTAPTDA